MRRSEAPEPDDSGADPEVFRVRSLTLPVYLPNFLFSVGQGAAIPVIALLALELGASPAMAGVIVALRGLGTMLFDLPAGVLVGRLGERRSMILATVALVAIAVGIGLRPSLLVYSILIVLMGGAWSVWTLARLAFATESSPMAHRGRVMSMMGGVTRMGQGVGPFLGGVAVIAFGLAGPFVIQAVLAAVAALSLVLAKAEDPVSQSGDSNRPGIWQVFRDHRRVFGTAGVAVICVQALRSSRQAIIPLWGDQLGINASQISLIFGLSTAMEIVVFYPMGMLMDRKGRKWAAIPSISLLSLGVAAIPLASGAVSLVIVGLVIGFANGLGSGLNMTLGSDFSPAIGRSEFLGVWRLVTDVGTMGGPLVVAGITSIASLAAACVAIGAVGAAGAVVIWRAVPETLVDGG